MRQVEFVRKGLFEWREVASPTLGGPKEALVRPFAIASCDIDRFIARGEVPMAGPFPFGHEGVAEVVEVGDAVKNFTPGDLVSVPFQISCGECASCRRGRTAHCTGTEIMSMYGLGSLSGGSWGGLLADLVRVPFADHMLVAIPEEIDPIAIASLSDNIVDGWRLVAPALKTDPFSPVLIVAGASVSLYATAIALALGASHVDYVGGERHHQEIAARLGARVIEGPIPVRLGPYPITVNASSDRSCLHCAVRSTAPDGTCTSAGIFFGGDTPVPLFEMYVSGINFRTGRVHARQFMPEALELVRKKAFQPELVTGAYADWNDAPEALAEHQTKLVITRDRLGAH